MNCYEEVEGYSEDGLLAGEYGATVVHNVSLSANASVSRGELICAGESGTWSPVTSAQDGSKALAIAACNCVASSLGAVTQAFMAGVFEASKVIVGGGLQAEAFREPLRKDNIQLTRGR